MKRVLKKVSRLRSCAICGIWLLDAIEENDLARLRQVITDHPTYVNKAYDSVGNSALMLAATNGYAGCLLELLEHGAFVEAKNKSEYSALMLTAVYGYADCMRELLNVGANTEASDKDGDTALMIATRGGHTDCVRLLLAADANLDSRADGVTALFEATRIGLTDCIELLGDAERGKRPPRSEVKLMTPLRIRLENERAEARRKKPGSVRGI